jgi:hypothetical protein
MGIKIDIERLSDSILYGLEELLCSEEIAEDKLMSSDDRLALELVRSVISDRERFGGQ